MKLDPTPNAPDGALKSCPLCGGASAVNTCRTTEPEYIALNGRDTGYGVNCVSCGLNNRGIAIGYATEAEAVAAWNRRATTPVSDTGPKWMRADEQWPQFYETVLLNCEGELLSTGYLAAPGTFHVDAEDPSDGSRWVVTHWMKLPAAPNAAPQSPETARPGESTCAPSTADGAATSARNDTGPRSALNPAAAWPFPEKEA